MTLDEHIEMCIRLREQRGCGGFQVMFGYNSGDYWRTEISQEVTDVDIGYVIARDYHGKDKPVVLDEDTFFDMRHNQIEEQGELPPIEQEQEEEGHTQVVERDNEVMQVVLLTAY